MGLFFTLLHNIKYSVKINISVFTYILCNVRVYLRILCNVEGIYVYYAMYEGIYYVIYMGITYIMQCIYVYYAITTKMLVS